MRPTGVPQLIKLGERYESVVRGKSVRNHPAVMQLSHAFSLFSLCSLANFGQVQREPVCVTRGFRRVSLQMQCGPMQAPYGLWNNQRPVLQTSMGQILGL